MLIIALIVLVILSLMLGIKLGIMFATKELMHDVNMSKAILRLKNMEIDQLKKGIITCEKKTD